MRRQRHHFPPSRTPSLVLQKAFVPACRSLALHALTFPIEDAPHGLPTVATTIACLTATALALRFVTAGTIAKRCGNFFSSA